MISRRAGSTNSDPGWVLATGLRASLVASSMMAAVVYLTLGVLLARAQPQRRLKVYLIALVMLLVGISRVYLGVHWPTDVLVGWTVGTAWALMIWLIALWLQQCGEIERED